VAGVLLGAGGTAVAQFGQEPPFVDDGVQPKAGVDMATPRSRLWQREHCPINLRASSSPQASILCQRTPW